MICEPEYDDKCKVCGIDIPSVLGCVCWNCQRRVYEVRRRGIAGSDTAALAYLVEQGRKHKEAIVKMRETEHKELMRKLRPKIKKIWADATDAAVSDCLSSMYDDFTDSPEEPGCIYQVCNP